jgi:hypothetical protein
VGESGRCSAGRRRTVALYVDEIKDYTAIAKLRGLQYCHWCRMSAGTEAELRLSASAGGA